MDQHEERENEDENYDGHIFDVSKVTKVSSH